MTCGNFRLDFCLPLAMDRTPSGVACGKSLTPIWTSAGHSVNSLKPRQNRHSDNTVSSCNSLYATIIIVLELLPIELWFLASDWWAFNIASGCSLAPNGRQADPEQLVAGGYFTALGEHYHYNDMIMSAVSSQITSISTVCSSVESGAVQRKHQSSASLAFVRGIHRWPMNSPHKRPVTRKMFLFDDVIMAPQLREVVYSWIVCLWWRICSVICVGN